MSIDEEDDIGFDVDDLEEEEEVDLGGRKKKKKKRNTRPNHTNWVSSQSQFEIDDDSPKRRRTESSESSNFDNSEREEEEEEEEEEEREESENYQDIIENDNQEFFNLPPDDGPGDVVVGEQNGGPGDHVMNCFMCLYGNRGFDRLNDTHRDRMSEIFTAAINDSVLTDDEIGSQLWFYFSKVAIPDMQKTALEEGREFVPPPWSMFEARRHVQRVFHPTLEVRRMIQEIKAQKAKMMKHCFPDREREDGTLEEGYDKVANDVMIRLRNQLLSVMSRDPSKMIGGKDTEISTRALTGLWKDGNTGVRSYAVGDDWGID